MCYPNQSLGEFLTKIVPLLSRHIQFFLLALLPASCQSISNEKGKKVSFLQLELSYVKPEILAFVHGA
jgi:hypothetical protein